MLKIPFELQQSTELNTYSIQKVREYFGTIILPTKVIKYLK